MIKRLSWLLAVGILMGPPAWAYRALKTAVTIEDPEQPVALVEVSSSLQDTERALDGRWDTTLTFQLRTADPRLIRALEIELSLIGSQGEVLEVMQTPVILTGPWQIKENRQVRLERSYLGWPASIVQGRILKVLYAEGEPWMVAPKAVAIPTAGIKELIEPEEINYSTDSPYIAPTVLSAGGGTSGTSARPTTRPARPRPVRPRSARPPVVPSQNPANTSASGTVPATSTTPTSPFSNRSSLFQSPNSGSKNTSGSQPNTVPPRTSPNQPPAQPDEGEVEER